MISWIVSAIAAVFEFIPTIIWVILFWVGTILFWLGGEGLFGFTKIVLGIACSYLVLWILAALFPAWLEFVAVLLIVGLIWWAIRS